MPPFTLLDYIELLRDIELELHGRQIRSKHMQRIRPTIAMIQDQASLSTPCEQGGFQDIPLMMLLSELATELSFAGVSRQARLMQRVEQIMKQFSPYSRR